MDDESRGMEVWGNVMGKHKTDVFCCFFGRKNGMDKFGK